MYQDEIVDAHMHLWDLKNNYAWLSAADANMEKMLGDYSSLRKNFLIKDYLQLAEQCNISKAVHVQAFGFPDNPLGESQWLQDIADKHGIPNAIVAYANLADDNVEQLLARHIEFSNVRGVRMPLNWHADSYLRMTDREDYMQDANWLHGFALLNKYNLSFDMQIYEHQLVAVVDLAKQFPGTAIIIEHLAWPLGFAAEDFLRWQHDLQAVASCDNLSIKLSCVGCAFQRKISMAEIHKYIKTAINIFGVERCMFGSNFPPDSLFYSLPDLLDLVKQAVVDLPYAAQRNIFFSNAQRIYRL